jgi:2-polyprenyl-3-methyl-5-hydroxy-6-metoxy-1,4-benzoquinol methylase
MFYSERNTPMELQQLYSQYVNEQGLYGRNGYAALDFRCQQLFRHVDALVGKRMLEVGGGEGLFSMWALVKGFGRAIVLEPEGDGSSSGVGGRFLQHRIALGFSPDQLALVPTTLQEYKAEEAPFDVILPYSSINHIDEDACILLDSSAQARSSYVHVFEELFSWLRPGGSFVISDADRVNYWD